MEINYMISTISIQRNCWNFISFIMNNDKKGTKFLTNSKAISIETTNKRKVFKTKNTQT